MNWVDIATIITGIGSIIAIFVSIYAIKKGQITNQVNIQKDNDSKFIDDLYALLDSFNSEIAFSVLYRIDNVILELINKTDFADKNFNDFKIYISDILRNAKQYSLKVVSGFNSYIDKYNEDAINLCGFIMQNFYLINHDYYRKVEDYIDSLLEILRANGNFISLKDQSFKLVDSLCEAYFAERMFSEFIVYLSMQLRKLTQSQFAYTGLNKYINVFEMSYDFLKKIGLWENDGTISSPQLEELNNHLKIIKDTRRENLLKSLEVYNYKNNKNYNKKETIK